ncbi:MAG TPA: hypothetical protein VM536_06975, partial [Chloroflexia bacterium]|nr:hypothetical protein [Chloroflexia bacterium]
AVTAGVLLVSAALGALAFRAIYTREHTQVQASRWIYTHMPAGTRIGVEANTLALPLPLAGHPEPDREYRQVPLPLLDDQPPADVAALLQSTIGKVDVLVVDTSQTARTVPRLPWRYPVQIRYYDLLLAGRLGFTPVYTATSYPTLLGLSIPDDGPWVDPSFIDSSHPPIHIFQKTRSLSAAEWTALFAAAVQQPTVATRKAP